MRLHKKSDPYLFLLLPVLAYLSVVMFPIFSSLYYSLLDWSGIGAKTFVGFANYAKMLRDPNLRTVMLNSLIYTFFGTIFQVGGGLLLAVLVQRIKKGQTLVRVLLFTPVVISSMAMSQTFKKLLGIAPDGVVNALLGAMGLDHLKTAFLSDMNITLYVLIIVEAIRFTGLYMVVFHAAFASIDHSVLEAASIDGATKWQTLLRVQFPMIRPIIVNCVVLAAVGTFKAFDGPFILTNGGPGYATELMATYMYKQAFGSMDYGYGSALSLIIVLECLLIYGLINLFTKRKD